MRLKINLLSFFYFQALVFSSPCNAQILRDPGVYIRQIVVNDSIARITVSTNLVNESTRKRTFVIRCGIWDQKEFLTRDIRNVELNIAESITVTQDLDFGMPELWNGPNHPFLYKIILEVIENGKIVETKYLPLGLRNYQFNKDNRFILNNKVFPLHGVVIDDKSIYPDNADRLISLKKQLKIVRISGANAVSLPNKLQTNSVFSLCDSLGLITWGNIDNPGSGEIEPQKIEDFIRRNYNHPSIFFWSSGNWTYLGNRALVPANMADSQQMEKFKDVVYKEDPGRFSFHENDAWWIPYDSIERNLNADGACYYKARWSVEPVISIAGKKDSVNQNVIEKIVVYSNLYDPELEVNGKALDGRKEGASDIEFQWENVVLKQGWNRIRAFGSRKGIRTEDIWNVEVK